ncbi:hypothetical protein JKP88DRAFT_246213 [Tribonema minus]|uniref:Uncharacterized protein n=1 Tax=Tribonema minus TaxID=303371 RepID=A0A835YUD3_9STRA|nr:hypothetical protein JKP88DRAFT_246213 [Tribonema minus]
MPALSGAAAAAAAATSFTAAAAALGTGVNDGVARNHLFHTYLPFEQEIIISLTFLASEGLSNRTPSACAAGFPFAFAVAAAAPATGGPAWGTRGALHQHLCLAIISELPCSLLRMVIAAASLYRHGWFRIRRLLSSCFINAGTILPIVAPSADRPPLPVAVPSKKVKKGRGAGTPARDLRSLFLPTRPARQCHSYTTSNMQVSQPSVGDNRPYSWTAQLIEIPEESLSEVFTVASVHQPLAVAECVAYSTTPACGVALARACASCTLCMPCRCQPRPAYAAVAAVQLTTREHQQRQHQQRQHQQRMGAEQPAYDSLQRAARAVQDAPRAFADQQPPLGAGVLNFNFNPKRAVARAAY